MKKTEKIERLLTISYYGISEERLKEIAKKWSHNGLDILMNMWHKYYNTTAHECISELLISFSEKELCLQYLENCLKGIEKSE